MNTLIAKPQLMNSIIWSTDDLSTVSHQQQQTPQGRLCFVNIPGLVTQSAQLCHQSHQEVAQTKQA